MTLFSHRAQGRENSLGRAAGGGPDWKGWVERAQREEECLWLLEREAEPGQYGCSRSRQRVTMPDVMDAQGHGSRQRVIMPDVMDAQGLGSRRRVMMPDAEVYATRALPC